MVRLIARRPALGVITIMLVSGIIFVGLELLPGDACTAYLGQAAGKETGQLPTGFRP